MSANRKPPLPATWRLYAEPRVSLTVVTGFTSPKAETATTTTSPDVTGEANDTSIGVVEAKLLPPLASWTSDAVAAEDRRGRDSETRNEVASSRIKGTLAGAHFQVEDEGGLMIGRTLQGSGILPRGL